MNEQVKNKKKKKVLIVIIILCFLFGIGPFLWFKKRAAPGPDMPSEETPVVTITKDEVTCTYPTQHKTDKVRWDHISRIDILTTNEGPAKCDVFIMLQESPEKGVAIPQTSDKSKEVVDRILQFPGFDHKTFIAAMGSAEYKWFRVWDKKEETK